MNFPAPIEITAAVLGGPPRRNRLAMGARRP